MSVRRGLIAGLLITSAAARAGETPQVEPYKFLREQLQFSSSDLANLEKGRIVVKLPKTAEKREVAAFAITRLDVSSDFFIERVRDIAKFKKSANVLQIAKFSSPPRLEDLADLTLDEADIDSLKKCRLKSCELKMSAASIDRLRKEVDWSAPNYRDQVNRLLRVMLLEHVQAYLKGGNAALGKYEDKSYALEIEDEVRALLKSASYMYGYMPELQRYLEEFPMARPKSSAHVEDFVYWSKEDFGLKPVITLTHVTIYGRSPGKTSDVIVASKGIYATHYLEGSLGLTAFIRSQQPNLSRSYLIYTNRSRTDALRGLFAGLKRSMIGGHVRSGAEKNMEMVKQKLEAEYLE